MSTVSNSNESQPIQFLDPIEFENKMQNQLYNILFSNSVLLQFETEKYNPNETKEGSKRLISRCNPKVKVDRKNAKVCMGNYLRVIFAFRSKPLNNPEDLFQIIFEKRRFSIKNKNMRDLYEIFTDGADCENFIIKNRVEYICMNEQDKKIFSKNIIISLFNGSRCEIVKYPHWLHTKASEYWDDWWSGESNEKETHPIDHYRDSIYPMISSAVLNVLQLLKQQNGPESSLIMEIAGGNGELAEIILSSDQYPKNANYVFLELNEPSIKKAETKLEKFSNVEIFKTDLVNDKDYGTIKPSSIDLVLGSGILTRCVLNSKMDAETILKKVHYHLKPEGYLILAGHAEMLLSSKDFENEGFNVINCTANGNQLYILQKQSPFESCLQQ